MKKSLNILHKFFYIIWKEREDFNNNVRCFECNKLLKSSLYLYNSSVYSHILAKSEYPLYALKRWNLKICCPSCHFIYTHDKESAIKQYNEYLRLLELHYKGELK